MHHRRARQQQARLNCNLSRQYCDWDCALIAPPTYYTPYDDKRLVHVHHTSTRDSNKILQVKEAVPTVDVLSVY